MKPWVISTYSKQILGCRTAMDTRGYVHNKVASVAVGSCAVTELPLAFAALCAQDYVLPGRNAAMPQRPPPRLRTVSAYAAHRLRIGHA